MSKVKTGPLFKYIGGKSWLKDRLNFEIADILESNQNIDTYVEPFAGGLGAFLGVYETLLKYNIKNIVINDVNEKIINFYKTVMSNPEDLLNCYIELENGFINTIPEKCFSLHKIKDKEEIKSLLNESYLYFLAIRNSFNSETDVIKSSAQLLFLQHHCFNGIYRENSKGGYNTPFNWEARVVQKEIIREKLYAVLNTFNNFNISFTVGSFENINYGKNAIYYLDPPYINEVESMENSYNKDSFNSKKQIDLINLIKDCKFLYSNHEHELLEKEFSTISDIEIIKIARKNIISSSKDSRKNDKIEILVKKK